MTPIIAGTICGICVGTAWLVALIVVIVKRTKRKKRKRAGEDVDDDVPINASSTDPEGRPSRDIFIVPPDPAVLQGQHQPGERLVVERKKRWWRLARSGDAKCSKGKEKQGEDSDPCTEAKSSEPLTEDFSEPEGHSEQDDGLPPSGPTFNRLSTIMSVTSPGKTSSQEVDSYPREKGLESKDFADFSYQNSVETFDEEKIIGPPPRK